MTEGQKATACPACIRDCTHKFDGSHPGRETTAREDHRHER